LHLFCVAADHYAQDEMTRPRSQIRHPVHLGAMLAYTYLPDGAVWFVLLLLVVVRPISVWL
jgi:hypothetical protein